MINNQDKKLTSDAMFTAARDQYITDINRLLIRSETKRTKTLYVNYIKKLKETFFCGQGETAYYLSQFYYNS